MRLPGWRDRGKDTYENWSNNDKDAPDYASRLVGDVCEEEQEVPTLKKAHVGLIMELHTGIWAGFFLVLVSGVLFLFSFNLDHNVKINCQKALWKLQFPITRISGAWVSVTWVPVSQSLYQGATKAFPRQQFVSLLAAECGTWNQRKPWLSLLQECVHGYADTGTSPYGCVYIYLCRKGKCVMIQLTQFFNLPHI